MRFDLDEQQRDFAASIDAALAAADLPGAVRAWAAGDTGPGRKVWARLADLGVTALAVPERFDGIDAHPADLVVAFERHHQVHRIGVQAVELLRHHQCGHTEVGQLLPYLAARRGIAFGPRAYRAGQVRGAQCRVDARGEVALLFIERKFPFLLPAFSRGNPSSRSEMILR